VVLTPPLIKQNGREIADIINHQAVKMVPYISSDNQVKLIHVSTIMFFDGNQLLP
jgi:dTDP-4-dehydrorhamnose reductase